MRNNPANAPERVPNRSKVISWATGAAGDFNPFRLVVEIVAALFGVAGTFLLAMPTLPAWGFGAFLVSNICWLVSSWGRENWSLFAQQIVFLVGSLIGLWNWWLGPLLLG